MKLLDFVYSASIFILSILLLRAIYTTKRRRLRLPPSPFSLPIIGHLHLLGPKIHHSFHNLSKRYGPLFHLRLGSNRCVVVSTPELAKEFLKTHEIEFAYRKNSSAINLLTYHVSFAFAPYGPYWKYIKKITTYKLLGNRNLTHFEPIRTLETYRVLLDLMLKSKEGESVNLTEEMIKLTSNVISQMMLSVRCSDTVDGATNVRNVVRDVTELFGEFDVSDIIWFCKNTDLQGIKKRAKGIHERYDALLEKIISDREKTRIAEKQQEINGGIERNDFLDILLDAMEDDTSEVNLSRNHIKAIILDFLTAATDTTAISLEWALSELINNPRVLKKAQEEINNVVGNERLVKELDTPNLPYIKAIIKETFRLHPPIPMLIRKSINDCQVAGYDVPKNTMLFVNIWSIGRNPRYWEKASEFLPERFLAETYGDGLGLGLSQMDINGQYFELMPFGTGRRGCPGMPLAMQELPNVLSLMIQCFDYIPLDLKGVKSERVINMDERPGLTAPRANELMCLLKPRIDLPKHLGNVGGV